MTQMRSLPKGGPSAETATTSSSTNDANMRPTGSGEPGSRNVMGNTTYSSWATRVSARETALAWTLREIESRHHFIIVRRCASADMDDWWLC